MLTGLLNLPFLYNPDLLLTGDITQKVLGPLISAISPDNTPQTQSEGGSFNSTGSPSQGLQVRVKFINSHQQKLAMRKRRKPLEWQGSTELYSHVLFCSLQLLCSTDHVTFSSATVFQSQASRPEVFSVHLFQGVVSCCLCVSAYSRLKPTGSCWPPCCCHGDLETRAPFPFLSQCG